MWTQSCVKLTKNMLTFNKIITIWIWTVKPHLNVTNPLCTHILEQRDALILIMVKRLLLSQVLVLGRLETHGDHLCTGQHLAVFDAILAFVVEDSPVLFFQRGCPCQSGWRGMMPVSWLSRDEMDPACCPLPAVLRMHVNRSEKPRLHTASSGSDS